ncbi:MAG: methyl-accepting chemotaxis protein [Undibacterium umbellatum]|uniref:methyl-accepting chemotaxis protein n=1 Tax=Undibacterium umbellatum TaxID=2762300 RepID=UPI003BB5FF20
MSNIVVASAELKQFLAAPTAKPKYQSAFDAHGLWVIGVVLMRNVRFSIKALIIGVLFIVPIVLVSYLYYDDVTTSIQFSSEERVGVEYNREVVPLLNMSQQWRRDAVLALAGTPPASLDATKEKLASAQSKVAELEKRLGKELRTSSAYAAMQAAFAQTTAAKDVDAAFKAHSDHVQSVMDLLVASTDGSNLTLDPDIGSYYIMDAVFFRMSDIAENTAKLRGIGTLVIKAGSITPEQQRKLSESVAIGEFQMHNMLDSLAKVKAKNPELSKVLDVETTMADTKAFIELARKTVVDHQEYTPETLTNLIASANKTLEGQYLLAERLIKQLDMLLEARVSKYKVRLTGVSIVFAVFFLLATYFFIAFYKVTNGGLLLMRKHLQEMSTGDLRFAPAPAWGRDETADVIADMRLAYDSLHELIRTVRHSARALHHTSSEISSASLDLSSRSENAAASLEEQAASMEEIGSTVNNTTDKATMAARFAADNANVAEEGGKIIANVVETMHNIHASSAKISDIISVIDGIAFQTNILALNAAVEAARAGESGRGFAVVASEVRSLAHRSADAAKEIKNLISNSVDQIDSGTVVVEKAGTTMNTMVNNARQINEYLTEIANASKEQALGVSQVTTAINELDEHTQQNAALVEETAAAAGALTQQAETLQSEIANFIVA